MMGFGGGFGMLFGPLIFVGLILLVVYLVNGGVGWNNGPKVKMRAQEPLDILDERLARGDIDQREYDEKRRVLKHG